MKFVLVIITVFILFINFSVTALAQIITVDRDGEVVWNVLSLESDNLELPKRTIEIKETSSIAPKALSQISLLMDTEKITLAVDSGREKRELELTGDNKNLLEIEERPETQRVIIGVENEMFTLLQKGVVATTSFPLTIDSKSAKISVTTLSGERFIVVLPYQAAESALRSKMVSIISYEKALRLVEEENELIYIVNGEKELTFFNFYTHSFPVEGKISALDGVVLNSNEPVWLKVLDFLFG